MMQPKRTKYRKAHKGRNRGFACVAIVFLSVNMDLNVLVVGELPQRQLEAARRAIARITKRAGKMWIQIFPDKPITKKPLEVRMGKGKGSVEYWVALLQPGRMVFELDGVTEEIARDAFLKAVG